MNRQARLIHQSLLDEHHGNVGAALEDLACRYAAVIHGVSFGAIYAPPAAPVYDLKPRQRALDVGHPVKEASPHG